MAASGDPATEEWEALLMEDPGAEDFVRIWEQDAAQRAQVRELEASLRYAQENGYDVDPITGQYLPPDGS